MVKLRFYLILLLFAFTILLPKHISAQQPPKLYLEVTPTSGALDEVFIFSVVIEDEENTSYPYLLGGDDFKLTLIGPQTSIQIENGVVQRKSRYTYRLIPKREGALETPAAEIEIGGKKVKAEPLKVNVTKATAPQLSGSEDVFLRQAINKKTVFLGEQLSNTIELYTSIFLADVNFPDNAHDGFWQEPMGNDEESTRKIDGRTFRIIRRKRALFPLRSGTLALPAQEIEAKIRQKGVRRSFPFGMTDPFDSDLFDDFFGNTRLKEVNLKSNALEVEVKELPPLPPNFSGWNLINTIVGATDIAVDYSKDPIKVGETKTIAIEISSTGNLSPIKSVPLEASDEVKVYQETPDESKSDVGGQIITHKNLKLSLVPLKPGKFELPGIELGYFDPGSQSYKIAKTAEIAFQVEGEAIKQDTQPKENVPTKSESQPTVSPPQTTPLELYKEETTLERLSNQISLSLSLLLLGFAIIVIFMAILVWRFARSKRPLRELISRIHHAKNLEELGSAFRSYLAFRLMLGEGVVGEQLKAFVRSKVPDQNVQFALQGILDEFDVLLYGQHLPSDLDEHPTLNPLKERILSIIGKW